MARLLTRRDRDGRLEVVGFNPMMGFYETYATVLGHAFGVKWFDSSGRSNLSRDPAFSRMLRWQKALVDWYSYAALRSFCDRVGDNFSPNNAFQTGELAMTLDGEWRTAFIAAERPDLDYATAPFPVDEARPELYGSGCVNGTIVGIPARARNTDQAWNLVRFLISDEAVVPLANALRNIPATNRALRSPDLVRDERFAVFLDIYAHPLSTTQPVNAIGGAHGNLVSRVVERWQAGEVRNLEAALRDLDRDIDDHTELALEHRSAAERGGTPERVRSSRSRPVRVLGSRP